MDSLKELKTEIDQFNKERDWDQFHSPANLAKSISIEAAELLECFQWNDEKYDTEQVKEELADVINYCLQMSSVMGFDVKEIVEAKMKKTAEKYPVEKCKGKSAKYDKL
jgi:NTP pyrophosphatase (non-canonical NTP hydrolase)